MKPFFLLFTSVIISCFLFQCSDLSVFSPKRNESVSVSNLSKRLGIKEYNIENQYVSLDSQIVNFDYKIISQNIKNNIKMSFNEGKVLKLNFKTSENVINQNKELILDFEKMSLSYFDGIKYNGTIKILSHPYRSLLKLSFFLI